MTREEAIKMLKSKMDGTVDTSYEWAETVRMAIEALHKTEAQPDIDEWCTDCKEYNHERHCCPRWNRVIRETLKDMQIEKRTEKRTETHACDCISRQEAIEALDALCDRECEYSKKQRSVMCGACHLGSAFDVVEQLPSAQPERTCVNCGRTANNGGWYADGGTRCPIEEHYALPKDGYCHLWEKRNVTDDDYPERRTDE